MKPYNEMTEEEQDALVVAALTKMYVALSLAYQQQQNTNCDTLHISEVLNFMDDTAALDNHEAIVNKWARSTIATQEESTTNSDSLDRLVGITSLILSSFTENTPVAETLKESIRQFTIWAIIPHKVKDLMWRETGNDWRTCKASDDVIRRIDNLKATYR